MIRSDAYAALRAPGPAGPFLRWAAICEAAGDRAAAAAALLQGAWALDDAGADAAGLRGRAVALWGPPLGPEDALRTVDILRRAGRFDDAAALAGRLASDDLDENSAAILSFQRQRIADRDDGRHGIGSALRPPARRPHVTHGQAASTGLWRRLFGA